jgi:FkbM family methyltransferase
MLNKLKSVYRIFFPEKTITSKYLETRLSWLPGYKTHTTENFYYTIEFNDYKVVMRGLGHSDVMVYNQIFIDEEYKIIKEILLNVKKDKYQIIDAGANVGYTSLYFALDSNADIVAVEPSSNNVLVLKKNIELNQLANKIEVRKSALSCNSQNKYKIDNHFRDGLDWSTTTILDSNGDVDSISIGDLYIEKKWDIIDLLKIDIEGAEAEIFRSDINFLTKTRVIAIEVHEEFISNIEIETILKNYGFIVFSAGELTVGVNKNLI